MTSKCQMWHTVRIIAQYKFFSLIANNTTFCTKDLFELGKYTKISEIHMPVWYSHSLAWLDMSRDNIQTMQRSELHMVWGMSIINCKYWVVCSLWENKTVLSQILWISTYFMLYIYLCLTKQYVSIAILLKGLSNPAYREKWQFKRANRAQLV